MVHDERGASSRPFLSGWLTAFCAWDNKGVFFEGKGTQRGSREGGAPEWVMNLTFDGVWFPRISVPPEGYAEVDVILKELSGKKWDCTMLAGHVGTSMSGQGGRLDTVYLAPQWFMYHKGEERLPGRGFWYRT
ncbi:hypothetical protein H0H81_009692 [Sphagnurus paluster]|uniref:Uncharacterized protein n=1 Tax=Sphagnurus paluster TaxID=117069 RepID=A0A9P7GR59_9AGAR|nr:hypothetical protein H0H81_009692 [Sphagnurus paluster]